MQSAEWILSASLLAIVLGLSACKKAPRGPEPSSLLIVGQAPAFALTDQGGGVFNSAQLEGKPWVANFMFTNCPTTGPLQSAELKRLQDDLSQEIRLVSFTVDPSNDTAEVLANYAEGYGADPEVWTFLTGSKEEIRRIFGREGLKLAAEGEGDSLTHSPLFVLVDAYMRVRGVYDSQAEEALAQLRVDIDALGAEVVYAPAEVEWPNWMDVRRQSQLDSASSLKVLHDFSFADRRIASGITFRDKIVDDAGRNYKPVHYDHGTGIIVADVDGDDLLDIYFVSQAGPNGLWRNLGDGTFDDITDKAGVAVADRVCVSAAFGDLDNDGDPDLYVTSVRGGNVLFENLGDGTFRDVSEVSGVDYRGHSSSAVFFDYDRDGLADLFVANVGQYTYAETAKVTMESIRGESGEGIEYPLGFDDAFAGHLKPGRFESGVLYRNLGGLKFDDVTSQVALVDGGWCGDASPIDLNADGWTDLYMLNMQGDDEVFLNQDGKRFVRAGRELFPKTPWGAMGIKAFDFENDGDLDVYITDMHSDMSVVIGPGAEKDKAEVDWTPSFLATDGRSIFGNAFFRNGGDGSFEEISDSIGAENYWPWGLSVDDLNADGFDDVFITASMNFPYRYGVNSLLLNENGERFRDCEFILGVEPRAGGLAVPWFEIDPEKPDQPVPAERLRTAGVDPDSLTGRSVIWGAHGSRSSIIFDLDNDGDLDIVTNETNQFPVVLVSDLAQRHPTLTYLKVKLIGRDSNRSAFGAVVWLESGSRTLMKVKDGQSGYLSHSDSPLYFGLGGEKQIDRVRVTWPSGAEQVLEGPIEANQLLTVEEPEGGAG